MIQVMIISVDRLYFIKIYHIAQNGGGGKLWQINRFRVLVRKILANQSFQSFGKENIGKFDLLTNS